MRKRQTCSYYRWRRWTHTTTFEIFAITHTSLADKLIDWLLYSNKLSFRWSISNAPKQKSNIVANMVSSLTNGCCYFCIVFIFSWLHQINTTVMIAWSIVHLWLRVVVFVGDSVYHRIIEWKLRAWTNDKWEMDPIIPLGWYVNHDYFDQLNSKPHKRNQ